MDSNLQSNCPVALGLWRHMMLENKGSKTDHLRAKRQEQERRWAQQLLLRPCAQRSEEPHVALPPKGPY